MKTLDIVESWSNAGRSDQTFIARFDDEIRVGLCFAFDGKTFCVTYKMDEDERAGRVCFAEVRFLAIEVCVE